MRTSWPRRNASASSSIPSQARNCRRWRKKSSLRLRTSSSGPSRRWSTARRRRGEGTKETRLGSWLRVPPPAGNHDAFTGDLAVARQVLADDIDIVEAPIVDRQNGRVSDAARLEASELRSLQCERRIDGRGGDHIGKRHAEAEELRHGGDLVEGRAVDAERVNVGRNGVGQEAVGEHGARSLEGE